MPLYKLGKFILIRKLNAGGMAEIYLAKSFGIEGMERLLAVKRILPKVSSSEDFIKMFVDEAKLASKLSHPNIAQIYELGKEGNCYYIAMELVDGRDLRAIFDKLAKSGRFMPIPIVCKVVADICEGLDYAHNKCDDNGRPLNIVHRDVSLQNVLLSYEGEVKVIDFGVAKASIQSTETRAGVLKGKIGYMPPEQVAGQPIDKRGDVFATGVILWELLTNCRLFKYHTEYQILERVRLAEIFPPSTINPQVSPELEQIVLKALSRDPDTRYASASELHDALLTYLISHRQLPSTREVEQFAHDLFAPEIEQWHLILEDAQKISADMEGLVDLSEGDSPTPEPTTDNVRVVKSEASRPTYSMSRTANQSGSRRTGTNYASGALSFFGQGEQTASANATVQEMSEEALAMLRSSLDGKANDTILDMGVRTVLSPAPAVDNKTATVDNGLLTDTGTMGTLTDTSISPSSFMSSYSLRQKLFAGTGGLAVLVLLIALIRWLVSPSGTGTLIITTDPAGISVGMDGDRHVCDTPCTLPQVKAGSHKITIFMPGVEPVVRKIKVGAGGLVTVRVP